MLRSNMSNLKVYSNNPNDLSRMSREQFEKMYETILSQAASLLKQNGICGIVIGEIL